MFGRGSRFPADKEPEVPGPGAYDPKDPEFNAYKRGAFLEKQDRFNKSKPSDIPGPGTYDIGQKPDNKPSTEKMRVASAGDRLAVLQRKLEDLERVHAEGKRMHQADVERLKLELARTQRVNSETNERLEKLKKSNDAQDTRIQDLKKSSLTDQMEIKDLRAKLRVSEHDRTQLTAKQGEAGEAKRAVYALEAKRKEEVREKDRRIAELEKALAVEKKKRESMEVRSVEAQGKVDMELQDTRATSIALRNELMDARIESDRVKAALVTLKSQAEDVEEELLAQLDDYRAMLSRVAREYGRLVSSTVSKTVHDRVKHESLALQLRVNKLERKYSNTEGQVAELANMIRHTQDQNSLLSAQLRDAEDQLTYYASTLKSVLSDGSLAMDNDVELAQSIHHAGHEFRIAEAAIRVFEQADGKLWGDLDELRRNQLFFHSTCLLKHVDEARHLADQRSDEIKAAQRRATEISQELLTARADGETAKTLLIDTTSSLEIARATEKSLKEEVETVHAEKKTEVAKMQKLVKQEKEATQRLAGLVQQGKAIEEALNAELDQLASDLTEAEQYREAYCGMIDEVDALVRRNALAEDEAQKLSKFNAEILGHSNPQQRIMYVDKIRQELHETKQKLLMATKDKEAVINENDKLRHELGLYESVAVPAEVKPRTFVTRVTQAPLVSQNLNSVAGSNARSTNRAPSGKTMTRAERVPEVDYKEGDMTLDELNI